MKKLSILTVLITLTITVFYSCRKEKPKNNEVITKVKDKDNTSIDPNAVISQTTSFAIATNMKNIMVAFDNLSNSQFCELKAVLNNVSLSTEQKYSTIQNNPTFSDFISTFETSVTNIRSYNLSGLTSEDFDMIGNDITTLLGRPNGPAECAAANNAIKSCDRNYGVCVAGALLLSPFTFGGSLGAIAVCLGYHAICYDSALDAHFANCPSAFNSILSNPIRNQYIPVTSSEGNNFCN